MSSFYATMHIVFDRTCGKWSELESGIASISNTVDKGDAFEQFVYFYFEYHKDLYQIVEVYCDKIAGRAIPAAIRAKYRLERKDTGVDGANVLVSGAVTAWQAKFRSEGEPPTARELATFWTEAEYADNRCIIANCKSLPRVALKKRNHQQILLDHLMSLEPGFFEALYRFACGKKPNPVQKYGRRPHQTAMINDVVRGFSEYDRGKMIAACGTGKTMAALWVSEELKTKSVLFLAPSLALLRQTLEEWSMQRKDPFSYICVCSDLTIDRGIEDATVMLPEELDIPVSTDHRDVAAFLERGGGSKKVVFSTYQSLGVVRDAVKGIKGYAFDLILFDEAHRTAGVKISDVFALAVEDANIPARKRLFMTATERLVNPRIKKRIDEQGLLVLSMDDPNKYGPTLHSLKFGAAIKKGLISDYQIVLAGVSELDTYNLIRGNRILEARGVFSAGAAEVSAQDLFRQMLLLKAIDEFGVRKTLTFHSRLKSAKDFSDTFKAVVSASSPFEPTRTYVIGFVEGKQTSAERAEIVARFEEADIGVLSNVRCLAEGVDIPLIDAIFFSDPKDSQLEIVQAVGRALRQPYGEKGKTARIIIPLLIPEGNEDLKVLNEEDFYSLHSVVQAMRDQDEGLADWINQINLSVVKGRRKHHEWTGKISISLPKGISIPDFKERISVRIAEYNGDPKGAALGYGKLGKLQRKSTVKSSITPIGDYRINILEKSLVAPTIARFRTATSVRTREQIFVNNNNVSHTERLGLIRENDDGDFVLTSLGQRLISADVKFSRIFKNQILVYCKQEKGTSVYPYRMLAKVLLRAESLSYIEFLYGPYLIKASDNNEFGIDQAVKRVEWIRSEYPDTSKVNIANHDIVRQALNDKFDRIFDDKEVWSDRQTHGNRFGYFRNHLGAFDDVFYAPPEKSIPISLRENAKERLRLLLERSDPSNLKPGSYGELLWL